MPNTPSKREAFEVNANFNVMLGRKFVYSGISTEDARRECADLNAALHAFVMSEGSGLQREVEVTTNIVGVYRDTSGNDVITMRTYFNGHLVITNTETVVDARTDTEQVRLQEETKWRNILAGNSDITTTQRKG